MENKQTGFILAKWDSNWADEMDIQGFKLFTLSEWNSFNTLLQALDFSFDYYIGTNEEIQYDDGAQLREEIKIEFITEAEYNTIKKLFGSSTSYGYGFFPDSNTLEDEIVNETETKG